MLLKVNLAGSVPAKQGAAVEDKLGCYRLWARPKTPRKAVRNKQSHMILGPYPLGGQK